MTERLTLNVPEAARAIGISKAHAYQLIRIGELPAIRLGRRLLIPRKALDQFLESSTRPTTGAT